MLMKKAIWFTLAVAFALLPAIAQAQEAKDLLGISLGDGSIYEKSLKALTILLVLAILLENALAVIFNWRLYLTYFVNKGVRTLVMIAVSWAIVWTFHLDVLSALIDAYNNSPTPTAGADGRWFVTQFLTALIIAGGSSGVYSLMKALGYRKDVPEDVIAPKPPKDRGWVSVRTTRVQAVGAIFVKVKEVATPPKDVPSPIAGVVGGRRMPLGDVFFRNPNHFPQSGGYPLVANKLYEVTVEGKDVNGDNLIRPEKAEDRLMTLAPGAIVDLEVTI
jgi:hypothetical protein